MPTRPLSTLRRKANELAERIIERQYRLQPEIWKPYGDPGREKSVRDAGYHLSFLAEAVETDSPSLLNEYLAWVKVLFAGHKFPDHVLPTTLDCMRQVLSENLAVGERDAALRLLADGLQYLEHVPPTLPSFIQGEDPLDDLARRYLDALLRADRSAASRTILNAVDNRVPLRDIYLQVFQRTQHEIGRLWQLNQISVAQEHFCTAATQMIMSQLYPSLFTGERKDRCIVVACVGDELHETGARIVADFFEMHGWDSHFLGANTPPESVLRFTAERRADLLALSTTMTFHVGKVSDLIHSLRESEAASVRVLVGGYPFNLSPGLWRKVGADGYAADAETAISQAERTLAA